MTRVFFRVWPNGGDVIALMPDDEGAAPGFMTSYMHVGQHASANHELIEDLRPATRAEYLPLLRELEEIGYERITPS